METENPSNEVEKIKVQAKSMLIGRLPRKEGNDYKTVVIRFFEINNPHKTEEFPTKTLEFPDIEKVRIRRLNVSYYLEGNDIVVNDLDEAFVIKKTNKLIVQGYQKEVENRESQ
ncbi:hypothetical protein HOK51_09730 [Candidatus Woesearchaeota archaeon]|jgi:hypothetical protein|nr:hypothetical protein [Candidatus Woesearchaeota archaeon]MBT6520103.1 hypothetical protein [Candidatus Woesearchaeota archaeon]MBT7366708.1 hypothetical protein [Candidatus Woesearchaeota archaeon]